MRRSRNRAVNLERSDAVARFAARTSWALLITGACATALASNPIPGHYQEPGLSPNRDYIDQHVTEKIDPFTGKLQIHSVDLFFPGNGGLDIKVQRSYSSVDEFLLDQRDTNLVVPSPIGVGWSMHFGRVMRRFPIGLCASNLSSTNTPVVELPDGSRQLMYLMAPELQQAIGLAFDRTHWISNSRWRAECAANGIGMIVFSPDGMRFEMTTPGVSFGSAVFPNNVWYTTRIVDRNGNSLEFEYVNNGTATSVRRIVGRDAGGLLDGRQVTFNYSGNRLDTVTDGARIWTYQHAYSGSVVGAERFPFLARVVRPDGQSWRYEYNMDKLRDASGNDLPGAYSMRRIVYPTGGSYSYDYGFQSFSRTSRQKTTVVSFKRGSDLNVWQFSYDPADDLCQRVGNTCEFVDGSYDKTTIVAPDAVYEYRHIGANTVTGGLFWSIGMLLSKRIDGNEGIGWYELEQPISLAAQKISNSFIFRPGIPSGDAAVYAPISTGMLRKRNGTEYRTVMSDHDALGNARTIVETGPNGDGGQNIRTTTLQYYVNLGKWIIRLPRVETTSGIGQVVRDYDPGNANLRSENRYGVITSWTYTPQGDIESKTDARQNQVLYQNYRRGVPQREVHPESVIIARVVSDAGNVVQETDGEGKTVGYGYDGLNRITTIDHPLAGSADVTVNWASNSRVVTRGNYLETTNFDQYGRVASVTHRDLTTGQLISQTYAYDAYGRQRFASYPNDTRGTRTDHDVLGRVWKVEHATTLSGTPQATMSNYYAGNVVRMLSERRFRYQYVYRGFGNPDKQDLMQIITPAGVTEASVAITRNNLGQPLSVTQDGKARRFDYYPNYFLWKQTDPETGVTEFGRDQVGNMTSRKVGASQATFFDYDARNRLKMIRYQASAGIPAAPNVTRTYYRDDKVRTIESSSAVRSFEYDDNKNLTVDTLTLPLRPAYAARYTYDGNDALASITYGSGARVGYAPDAFGRPTKAAPYVTAVEHFANGAVKRLVYANGATTDVTQNARLWPETIVSASGIAKITNLTYAYDPVGNVSKMTDTVINGNNWELIEYDAVDRLTAAIPRVGVVGGQNAYFGVSVTYDGRGNIRTKRTGLDSLWYQYDPGTDLLTGISRSSCDPGEFGGSCTTSPYSYDLFGNITRRGETTFQYNAAQQLVCARCFTASEARYTYDGQGMRVSTLRASNTTVFVYGSAGNLMWEVAQNGEIKEYYYVAGKQVAVRRLRP